MMMKHIRGGVFALCVLTASQAHAVFVDNYSDWKAIPIEGQTAYLVGVVDDWLQTKEKAEPDWIVLRRKALRKCLFDQKITAPLLLELVSKHYENFSADWRVPPAPILRHVLPGMCLADINRERQAQGLVPWDRQPPQLSEDAP